MFGNCSSERRLGVGEGGILLCTSNNKRIVSVYLSIPHLIQPTDTYVTLGASTQKGYLFIRLLYNTGFSTRYVSRLRQAPTFPPQTLNFPSYSESTLLSPTPLYLDWITSIRYSVVVVTIGMLFLVLPRRAYSPSSVSQFGITESLPLVVPRDGPVTVAPLATWVRTAMRTKTIPTQASASDVPTTERKG